MPSSLSFFSCCVPKHNFKPIDPDTPALVADRSGDNQAPGTAILRLSQQTGKAKMAKMAIDVICGAHVQAFAGGLVLYGLGTWWLGGSGLLIASLGATIWLVSALTRISVKVAEAQARNQMFAHRDRDSALDDVISPSQVACTEFTAALGWATPPGCAMLILWDMYSLLTGLSTCCTPMQQNNSRGKSSTRDGDTTTHVQKKTISFEQTQTLKKKTPQTDLPDSTQSETLQSSTTTQTSKTSKSSTQLT